MSQKIVVRDININEERAYNGDTIKVTALLSNSPDSVKIWFLNPTDKKTVENKDMTIVSGTTKVYEYFWQSDPDDHDDGTWTIVIKPTKGNYTSRYEKTFELLDAKDLD